MIIAVLFCLFLLPTPVFSVSNGIDPVLIDQSVRDTAETTDDINIKAPNYVPNVIDTSSYDCNNPISVSGGVSLPSIFDPAGLWDYIYNVIGQVTGSFMFDKKISNNGNRLSYVHLGSEIKTKFAPKDVVTRDVNNFNTGSALRSAPSFEQDYQKSVRLENAILSHQPDYNGSTLDDQVGWACGGTCSVTKDNTSCRPVQMSEIVWYYYNQGKTITFNKIAYNRIEEKPLSGELVSILQNYYGGCPSGGCPYKSKFGVSSFQLMDEDCYKPFYDYLQTTDGGSLAYKVKICDATDGSCKTAENRSTPFGAIFKSSGSKDSFSELIPDRQEISNISFCNSPQKSPKLDRPNPLGFVDLAFKIASHVVNNGIATLTGNAIAKTQLDPGYVDGLEVQDVSANMMMPSTAPVTDDPSSSPEGVLVEPGQKAESTENFFHRWLTPAKWQSNLTAPRPGNLPTNPGNIGGDVTQWCDLIKQYAEQNDLDPALIAAIITIESTGDPNAISPCGAIGLMQVMPKDAPSYWFGACVGAFNPAIFSGRPTGAQLLDPEFNISYGTRLLRGMIDYWGSERDGIMHYGPINIGYEYADMVLGLYEANPDTCH